MRESIKHNLITWAFYSAIFYIILLPFYDIGWLKIGSIAIILGFFAGILNAILIKRPPPPSIIDFSILGNDEEVFYPDRRPPGERGPKPIPPPSYRIKEGENGTIIERDAKGNEKEFQNGQDY